MVQEAIEISHWIVQHFMDYHEDYFSSVVSQTMHGDLQLLGPRTTSSFPMAKRLAMSRVFWLSGWKPVHQKSGLLCRITQQGHWEPLCLNLAELQRCTRTVVWPNVISFIDCYCMLRSNFDASAIKHHWCMIAQSHSVQLVLNPLPM